MAVEGANSTLRDVRGVWNPQHQHYVAGPTQLGERQGEMRPVPAHDEGQRFLLRAPRCERQNNLFGAPHPNVVCHPPAFVRSYLVVLWGCKTVVQLVARHIFLQTRGHTRASYLVGALRLRGRIDFGGVWETGAPLVVARFPGEYDECWQRVAAGIRAADDRALRS